MAEIIHLYRCLLCHYEIEVTIATNYDCPCCQPKRKMAYITSRKRKE